MSDSNEPQTIYMMGIGGIAMGTLAGMLKEKGHHVTGSDMNLYPPMSDHIAASGIPVLQGYNADHPASVRADVYVVGNVIRRENPEAQYVLEHDLPHISMPQAIERFFLCDHESMVVAGTHGKSTTSSLLAWVLTQAGRDPSAFIGAFLNNWGQSYRLGSGRHMVLEGDEYDTAFFDKGPKFLHYRPKIGIVTSIEFDHADIFADFEAVYDAFVRFAKLIPPDGVLILNADDAHCRSLAGHCKGRVETYGRSADADWRLLDEAFLPQEVRFTFRNPATDGTEMIASPLAGSHNIANALSVTAAARAAGLSIEEIREGIHSFKGVKRRQEVLGEYGGILVMDDFAHHPTAVRETLKALKLFYPDRRLVAAFEPRTNSSRRSVFQQDYAGAFDAADCIRIKQPPDLDSLSESERLDSERLVHDIALRGKDAKHFTTTDELFEDLLQTSKKNDLLVCMSNGSFDGLTRRLPEALKERYGSDPLTGD